jgi:hypothetical protein
MHRELLPADYVANDLEFGAVELGSSEARSRCYGRLWRSVRVWAVPCLCATEQAKQLGVTAGVRSSKEGFCSLDRDWFLLT